MGATVSREHARLPFAYTHARKEDHSCNASSPSMFSTRQRIASRLLLLKSPDTTTSITPVSFHRFQQQHPLQTQQLGQGVGGGPSDDLLLNGQGVDPTQMTLLQGSHMTGSEEDDEDTEIVSLSSILIQGPEFELKWHAVGQDQDFLDSLMNGISGDTPSPLPPSSSPAAATTTTITADANNGQTTMTILSAVSATSLLQDTDSGHHEETCFLHSGTSTLDLAQNLPNRRTSLSGTGTSASDTGLKGEEHVHSHSPSSAAAAAAGASQSVTAAPSSDSETTHPQHPPSLACACSPTIAQVGSPSASFSASAGGSTTSITSALTNLLGTRRGSMLSTATTAVSTASGSTTTLPVTTSLTPLSPGGQPHHPHYQPQNRLYPHGAPAETDTDIIHGELIHLDSDKESERGNREDQSDESESEDDDCDEDYYDLDEEERTRKMDNRKMDLIAALGIADQPDEFEPEPFNFFKGEPIFHQQPDRFMNHPAATRRYTTDGVNSGRGGFRVPWGNQDDYHTAVLLPEDFFEGGLQSSIEEDDDLEGMEEQSDVEGAGNSRSTGEGEAVRMDTFSRDLNQDPLESKGRFHRKRLLKGKRAAGLGHAFSQSTGALGNSSSPWRSHGPLSFGDEDVAHLSPIPFSDLPSLTNIGLCTSEIVKLSSNIRLLSSATSIQLCCNDLSSIPVEIGHLRNLTLLDLSKNTLTSLPNSIRYLTRLVDLKLSFNFLTALPSTIGELTKLTSLHLDNNRLEKIPREIGRIKGLAHLDLDDNPLTVLPAEIGQLQFLRRLKLDRCPLVESFVHYPLHSPPTLLELAARVVVRHRMPTPPLLPTHLKTYLRGANKCSFCEGPYFESFVKRGKMIDKNDTLVPLEYLLCIPHWNTESERVRQLFCPRPPTAPPLPLLNSRLQPSRPASCAGSRRASKSESPLNPPLPTVSSTGYSSTTDLLAASSAMALASIVGSDSSRGESERMGRRSSEGPKTLSTKTRRFGSRLGSSGASTYSLDALPMTSSTSMTTLPLSPPVPPIISLPPFSEPTTSPPTSRSSNGRFSIRLRSRGPKSG
ncbi:hypothetical protein EMPS_05764 [Entomortierella parvispora]|uniref:L domain-like protein n=1 Tax=Entomortierella parvispora TaxID=205924 RepID=A0A9P3LWL6_9FUNG|nr:hypothetical protein EMPS_05764 [Entomortierella parvispora]